MILKVILYVNHDFPCVQCSAEIFFRRARQAPFMMLDLLCQIQAARQLIE